LEEKLNELGYSLLQRNKLHEASRLFAMAVHFFPQSANAYNSYAESLYHLGKKEEAIKQYQRALALDPNGVVGEDCRKMLLLLKQ
jgi:tetratricopeptide (TPR) repeat protein